MSIKSILGERIIKKLWPILSSFINEVTGESIVALISFRLEPSYPHLGVCHGSQVQKEGIEIKKRFTKLPSEAR